ncbi:phosphoethanolamine--lipid A transferase EptA [Arachidicoccus ginsenosidivorans]|uniref:Phosphoethanolamine--lipid A transferase EptA n=1 Tax=Arachidicoccus ginsenosidivorans TaxID=496057 RepID=A0A5B8VSY7_9BACT|nr:phosphoethanolamine--lipid A transferase EptA [Arachidicoccus ginsenosidivorans]QEC74393.1 phosphoethanolamine--lipid A transferase EptA [Arachidicoccus ginsenosidivorans]
MRFLKKPVKLLHFSLILSGLNFLLFHFPFFRFVFDHLEYKSLNGFAIISSLVVLMIVANAFCFYLLLFVSRYVGKSLIILFFIASSLCVYFINTYGVIIDESMLGNVINTKYEEASSFFSLKLILYILLLGVIPSIYIIKAKIIKVPIKRFLVTTALTLLFMLVMVFVNASNWLWIDKNSKQLGGLAMPWAYTVNIPLFYIHKAQKNQKEILLPNATIEDSIKSVVVLVIGESARRQDFSLYGYPKNTNPYLSRTPNVYSYPAKSAATYTTAGVKSILEHKKSGKLYEILPNYLYRNKVGVIWRTTNWGEPPVHIKTYQKRKDLLPLCKGPDCSYDEILLAGLNAQILATHKNKVLVVLHTSTSHGPTYSKKYPPRFETFKPVCNSVELGDCSHQELINAYDNTIVYTDYILHRLIEDLKGLKQYRTAMIFVSDHGESLGENNLYMHGLPLSIAPKEQYEIPFVVWTSDSTKQLKPVQMVSQNYVFHSVLNFLDIQSPIYNSDLSIFK